MGLFVLSYTIANAALAPITPAIVAKMPAQPLPAVLARIAYCESGDALHPLGNALAKNPDSSASGRFQFIRSTWEHYAPMLWGKDWIKHDVINWDDNTSLAIYVYESYGLADWSASRGCWFKI